MNKSGGMCAAALLLLALCILVLPLQWILALLLAALWHELCHYIAIRLCHGNICGFWVGIGGARLEVHGMTQGQELLCAMAGPVGGLLLLPLARWIPRIAICAAVQSAYNLLPVFPLDGGRALRCVLERFLPPGKTDIICSAVTVLVLCVMAAFGVLGCIMLRLGVVPLVASAGGIIRVICSKIPCKPAAYPIQ